jgi:hypothetical protein
MGITKRMQLEELEQEAANCFCGEPFTEEHSFVMDCSRCGVLLASDCVAQSFDDDDGVKRGFCSSCYDYLESQ